MLDLIRLARPDPVEDGSLNGIRQEQETWNAVVRIASQEEPNARRCREIADPARPQNATDLPSKRARVHVLDGFDAEHDIDAG